MENEKKNIFIIGDSYSTYDGFVPKGYNSYYYDTRDTEPIVNGVEKTWWRILSREMNFNIALNDSFSGSTVSNTVRENLTLDTSFINRIDKYINENFFSENKVDTIFIFGGTNDSWIETPLGELKYSDWSSDDLKNVIPAFCYLIKRAKEVAEEVIVILNTELNPEITNNFILACKNYKIGYVELKDIDKENGHPTVLGMEQIANQVKDYLLKK